MRFNFKKIAALGASVLLTGLSMGMATAATYPAPFVQSGVSNVAIVVGSSASPTDTSQAADPISANLQTYLSGSGNVSLSGEVVPLGVTNSEIYLGSSVSGGRYDTITSAQLPTTFADTTFSGGSDTSNMQFRVKLNPAASATTDKVIFGKQNATSGDPSYQLQMGTATDNAPLYNETIQFTSPVNFTDANNQGTTITLFGKDFTIGTDSSDANGIVLLTGAVPPLSLTTGGTGQTVTVDNVQYTITLKGVTDTKANVDVNGVTKPVSSGQTVNFNGISIGATNLFADTAAVAGSANVLVGSNKMYLKDGSSVKTTTGTSTHTIQGTKVSLVGGANQTTQIQISVSATGSNTQNIAAGQTFVDPVFGAFGITFNGMSSSLTDSARDTVSVANSGDHEMQLTMTDASGDQSSFTFAYNNSNVYNMSNPDGQVFPYEGANMSINDYTILASGGKLTSGNVYQVTDITNDTGTDSDSVSVQNVFNGDSPTVTVTTDGVATYYGLDGNYNFHYSGNAGNPAHLWARNSNAVSGESARTFVLYPSIMAQGGARVQLYTPLTVNLNSFGATGMNVSNFEIPQGDSYKSTAVTWAAGVWSVGGTALSGAAGANVTTANGIIYNFAQESGNSTVVSIYAPNTATLVTQPSVIVIEPKNDGNTFNSVVITTQDPKTSNKVGVGNVYFTDSANYNSALKSNDKLTDYVDSFGTMVQTDTSVSSQETATLTYPAQQSSAQLYFGAASSSVQAGSSSTQTGMFVVSDSQASSMSGKNLIVVGGSCVNTAAATLLGSSAPLCGADWESATGVGSGQFIVKSYSAANSNGLVTGSNIALLVAGYEAADTIAAANWLTTASSVDLSKTHTGTTSTGAVTVVS